MKGDTLRVIHDIIQPLKPRGPGWTGGQDVRARLGSVYPITEWWHAGHRLYVLSAVEVATDADGLNRGPEYHLSISKQTDPPTMPLRCSADEGQWVLTEFGALDGWEEDNHVPNGKVRNYWRAVAENMVGRECACKDSEPVIVEGDFEHRPLE